MTDKQESLVVRHVGDIYRNADSGKGHSWRILNGALTETLRTCITSHLAFEADDFTTIYSRFKGEYWFGTDNDGRGMGTSLYSIAVDCGNMSACLAFEKFKGFDPYLYLGRRLAVAGMPYGSMAGEVWIIERSAVEIITNVGTRTEADILKAVFRRDYAKRWWVTGFDSESIRLANYFRDKDNVGSHRDGKPTEFTRLTHDDLDRMSREIRAAIKASRPKK